MPSMSEGFRPASAMALRAASACSWSCDMPGTLPISVVSAAPTTATDFCFIGSAFHRTELGKIDLVGDLLEHDLDRHVELQRLRRLLALDDIGHHVDALVEPHHGDRVGRFVLEALRRAVVDD